MTEYASLAQLQRWAEADAKRLGLPYKVEVYWGFAPGGDGRGGLVPARCAKQRSSTAHAHTYEARQGGPGAVARICAKRGTTRETIHHEVAHFVPGGDAHGETHARATALAGSKRARERLIAERKVRCPKHQWGRTRIVQREVKVTTRGLVETVVYEAQCRRCWRRVGAAA